LAEAKSEPPEFGSYEANLPVNDMWGTALHSNLHVEELANNVVIRSAGRDAELNTQDDFVVHRQDLHKRKIIAKALEEGSRSVGKGLAKGAVEGISEATDAAKDKAKAGVAKAKSKLMAHFKKKDEATAESANDASQGSD
jgi:hypothetical protein